MQEDHAHQQAQYKRRRSGDSKDAARSRSRSRSPARPRYNNRHHRDSSPFRGNSSSSRTGERSRSRSRSPHRDDNHGQHRVSSRRHRPEDAYDPYSSSNKQGNNRSDGRHSQGSPHSRNRIQDHSGYALQPQQQQQQRGAHWQAYMPHQHQQQNQRQQQHHRRQHQQQQHGQRFQQSALNLGERDIGQVPNALLLVADLPAMVSESSLWNALKLLGPLLRIMVAKDRQTNLPWGFCFAEYASVEIATEALEKATNGSFKIQNRPVEIHYAHHGSFIPAFAPTQWTVSFGNEGRLAIYWDEQAFLTVYVDTNDVRISQAKLAAAKPPAGKPEAKDELDAFYAAMGDTLNSGPSSSSDSNQASIFSLPTTNGTVKPSPVNIVSELPAISSSAKVDKAQMAGIAAAQAAEQLAKAEEKKRKHGLATAGIAGGKKVSIQLQKWSTKQVELQSGEVAPPVIPQERQQAFVPAAAATSVTSVAVAEAQVPVQESNIVKDSFEPDELLDLNQIACLLCQRRFKTLQDLRKHQSLSELHKKNLLDPAAVQAALAKSRGSSLALALAASVPTGAARTVDHVGTSHSTFGTLGSVESLSTSPPLVTAPTDEEPKYRDRAAERRQIFGQPDYPSPPTPSQGKNYGRQHHQHHHGGGGGRFVQGDVIIPEQPTMDGIKEDNIGNRLLKSMGWKEGQGLGKDGEGIKAPIQASGYSQGVGIGAGLVRKADGAASIRGGHLSTYAVTAKDLARRRYEQAGHDK